MGSIRRMSIVSLCLFFGGIVAFLAVVWWYQTNGEIGLDESFIELAAMFRSDWLTLAFRIITSLGSVTFIVTADLLITAAGVWRKYKGSDLLMLNLANISGVTLMQVLKMFFGRERPPLPWFANASGFSFPSGHTLMTTIFYSFILYLIIRNHYNSKFRRWLIPGLGLLPVLVGISRVYLGVHYVSDVLGGLALGVAWVGLWMIVREHGIREQ